MSSDLPDIWSEWWRDMSWPTKRQHTMTKTKTHITYRKLRHLTSSDDLTFRVFSNGAIIGTCDICNTDYNTDNWEPGLMTIFVTWQLIVTLDSIRNSCDVYRDIYVWKINININMIWAHLHFLSKLFDWDFFFHTDPHYYSLRSSVLKPARR